jgi:hypothetical protein
MNALNIATLLALLCGGAFALVREGQGDASTAAPSSVRVDGPPSTQILRHPARGPFYAPLPRRFYPVASKDQAERLRQALSRAEDQRAVDRETTLPEAPEFVLDLTPPRRTDVSVLAPEVDATTVLEQLYSFEAIRPWTLVRVKCSTAALRPVRSRESPLRRCAC